MKELNVVGIDLAKSVFHVHGTDSTGKVCVRRKLNRSSVLKFFTTLKPCLVGMEACGGSHYWARELIKLGHEVRLIPPQYVKPYVKTNKSDAIDAEAICEAVTRPTMRYVDIKSENQQAILLIHRDREGLVRDRTALINRIRATLGEFGLAVPTGPRNLHKWFEQRYSEAESRLPVITAQQVHRMMDRLKFIESEVAGLDRQIELQGQRDEAVKRLEEIPGVGRLTASALVATVGRAQSFKSGRQFSAWLGLVPRQHSTGGRPRLIGISKRGDAYLRRMLIHGARAVLRHMNPRRPVTAWLRQLQSRCHRNTVIVALANKLARIVWALLTKGERYQEVTA